MSSAKAAFIKQMMSSYRRYCMIPQQIEGVKDLTSRMLDIAAVSVNKPQLHLFGSLVSGFCKRGTDADFSLTYRNFSPWLQGLARSDEQDRKRLTRFAREASKAGMTDVTVIHAVIPVVQLVDPHSTIHCDVTIGNMGGVVNSQILGKLRQIYPDFYGAYIHTVKEWGKAREMIAPGKGTFNSFTITVMALMVLQELALLPLFGRPSGELGQLTLQDAQRVVQKFTLPGIYDDLYGDDDKLGEAVFFCFQKFAQYYSKFDFVNGTVSLLCPRRERRVYAQISRKYLELFANKKRQAWIDYINAHPQDGPLSQNDLREAIKFEQLQHNSESPFIVEDFVNYINCGRRVHTAKVKYIAEEFERLAELMHPRSESSISFNDVMKTNKTLTELYPDKYHDPKVEIFQNRN